VRDTSYEITDYMSCVNCSVYPFFLAGSQLLGKRLSLGCEQWSGKQPTETTVLLTSWDLQETVRELCNQSWTSKIGRGLKQILCLPGRVTSDETLRW